MVNSLLLATVVRIGLVIISYGCKVPAGIFVPSMAVGATFGRMVGIIAKAIHAWVDARLGLAGAGLMDIAERTRRRPGSRSARRTRRVSRPARMPSWARPLRWGEPRSDSCCAAIG